MNQMNWVSQYPGAGPGSTDTGCVFIMPPRWHAGSVATLWTANWHVKQAFAGTRRSGDFQGMLRVSRSRLADRLERVVGAGLLERHEYFDRRTRLEYRLTEKDMAVYPILMALRAWGDMYLAPNGPLLVYRHADSRSPRLLIVRRRA